LYPFIFSLCVLHIVSSTSLLICSP
jgi:hypothetical protein